MPRGQGYRDPETNDFHLNQALFIPPHLRQEVFSFIQNNVVTKEEGIGRKTTGDGLIALTNWHLFENQLPTDEPEHEEAQPLTAPEIVDNYYRYVRARPAGNDLGMLDRRYLRGSEG